MNVFKIFNVLVRLIFKTALSSSVNLFIETTLVSWREYKGKVQE